MGHSLYYQRKRTETAKVTTPSSTNFGPARSGFDGVLLSRYKEVNNCKKDIRSQFVEIKKEAKDAKKHEIIYSVDTRCSVNFSTIKRGPNGIIRRITIQALNTWKVIYYLK